MTRTRYERVFWVFVCDFDATEFTLEVTKGDDEAAGYVPGYDKLPAGWIQVHDARSKAGQGIPTHWFCKQECLTQWKHQQVHQLENGVTVL